MAANSYDVVIVGAGIAGSAMAHALTKFRPSLHVALLERSLAEPSRIVGELLQPGGMHALRKLGLADCVDVIDAVPVHGYCVVDASNGRQVHIPYPRNEEGRSFHHGRFVMKLREAATAAAGVDVIEGAVGELVECSATSRVIGVRATTTRKGGELFLADLVIVADGCFSNFRGQLLPSTARAKTKSHFVGAILHDAALPIARHGTVALVPGSGPVLMYQIGEHETRILLDVKEPLPRDLRKHITERILPHLPGAVHVPLVTALETDRLKKMPNSFLPPVMQPLQKEGAILLGDAWNMRHPLTGAGMTVALTDVLMLSQLLAPLDLKDWDGIATTLQTWHWRRKPLAAMINVLSVALYDLFGADSPQLAVLRTGCFKYFELGGECVAGPVGLLSGLNPSFATLFYHFFSVALYAIWVLFTHPRPVPVCEGDSDSDDGLGKQKTVMRRPRPHEYPGLVLHSFSVFWTACVVFLPLMWSELRWW